MTSEIMSLPCHRRNSGEVTAAKSSDKEVVTQEKVIDTGIYYHPDLSRGSRWV